MLIDQKLTFLFIPGKESEKVVPPLAEITPNSGT